LPAVKHGLRLRIFSLSFYGAEDKAEWDCS
ncbi:MAG: hypothetical protein ACI8TS_000655, partial [Flavobacteriales bacterium]